MGKRSTDIKELNTVKHLQNDLTRFDLIDLMGVNQRGFKRHRGAWRQA